MKIAIIIPYATISYSGGVPVQGRMWKEGLEKLGNTVDLVNVWNKFDWNSYDYILFLGKGKILIDYVNQLKGFCHPKLISAPIIDYHKSFFSFVLRAKYFGSIRFKINKPLHDLYYCRNIFDFYLVRSEYEKRFICDGFGVDSKRVFNLPLSFRTPVEFADNVDICQKENFCFHSSRLGSYEKNVERLIKAAIKYNFNLVLGGSLKGKTEEEWLYRLIDGHTNIKYVGWLSDDDLYNYYRRAKVFALPSIAEGVGMVALEAALFGCEIVLTNIGAPKEYFNNMAYLVNPFDVDDIGQKIISAMNNQCFQPKLKTFITEHNNSDTCLMALDDVLKQNL